MATTLKIHRPTTIRPETRTMGRPAAADLFARLAGAAGIDAVEVVNSQGHTFLHWDRWQGHKMCEEPLAPRAANSRHNRRRK